MNLFRKEKTIDFDEKKIKVYEIGFEYLLEAEKGDMSVERQLELCTSLTADEIKKLSVEAFNKIYNAFIEINQEHFKEAEKNKDSQKKNN